MLSDEVAVDGEIIRPFRILEEFQECVDIQKEVWGASFSELVPVAILKASQRLGGVASGAFRNGRMIGFVYGITGPERGRLVHWSDMLAVRPGLRSAGLGTRMKWYQRDVVMSEGADRMYWTFDPLQAKNAYLNLSKLGIVADEYHVDMYGETESPLHRGIGTDRFVARWELNTDRVRARRTTPGSPPTDSKNAFEVVDQDGLPWPGPTTTADGPWIAVPVPSDVDELKSRSLEAAVAWRRATRDAFHDLLERGYEVREFDRGGDGVARYLLTSEL